MAATALSVSSSSPSSPLARALARPGPVVRSLRGYHARGQPQPQLGVVGGQFVRAHSAALDQQPAGPAGPGDVFAQPRAGRLEVTGRPRAVSHPVQQILDRGQRLGVGGVPFGQELLVLLVQQDVHRHPAVGQRGGHPAFLQGDVGAAGRRVRGRQQVGIDLALGEPLLEVADQPGVHLRGQLAALGLVVPDVQADDPVRLGSRGLQPRPDVPDRGRAVVDLVQDGFGRGPEHGGQRVARREQPPPDAGQRGQGVGRRHGEQRQCHVAPGQFVERPGGQLSHAVGVKVHASQLRAVLAPGGRPPRPPDKSSDRPPR